MSRCLFNRCRAFSVLISAACCSAALAQPDASQPQGPITLTNGKARLTINPSVGRIVDYGRVEGPNLLRINDPSLLTAAKADAPGYQGYGGDMLWPAQQDQWGGIRGSGGTWPPLGEMDGPNWTVVDQSATHVTIQSPQGPLLGLVAKRRFELKPDSTEVIITNTFERKELPERAEQYPVLIWSVTGVVEPEYMLADVSPERREMPTFVALNNSDPGALVTNLEPSASLRFNNRGHGPGRDVRAGQEKLGMYGSWLAAIYADDIFLQRTEFNPKGLFPDKANIEIYSSQGGRGGYVEVEILSAAESLKVGQSMTNTVHWQLVERPKNISDEELARRLAAGRSR